MRRVLCLAMLPALASSCVAFAGEPVPEACDREGVVLTGVAKTTGRPALQAASAEMITVNAAVTLNSGLANGSRLGINVNYWEDDQSRRPAGSPLLSEALAGARVTHLRYPGGAKSDVTRWSVPPYSGPSPRLALISPSNWPSNDIGFWSPAGDPNGHWTRRVLDFDAFMVQCRAISCEPSIVVAYGSIYKPATGGDHITRQEALDMAAAWVRYANVVKGYNVKYWEIGNETWLDNYANQDPGRTTQANDLIAFSRAMKAVDPTIKIGANANSQADFDTLLSIAAADVDFLVVHRYPPYGLTDYSAYQATTLNTQDSVSAAYNALQNYPAHRDRIKIMMTEISGMTFGSWNQADLGHALMTFESLARVLQDSRVQFSLLWNTRWIDASLGEAFALNTTNGYTAQGWALRILGKYVLDQMVAATDTANVVAFASRESSSRRMNVFLLNKSSSPSQANVTFQNYAAPATASVMALTGNGPADQNPLFASRGTVPVTGNSLDISLSPVSITVVQFSPGQFHTVAPCRIVDTRNATGPDAGAPPLASTEVRTVATAGKCGLSPTATSLALNVTISGAAAPGYLTLYAADAARPATSTINFVPSRVRANNAFIPLAVDGTGLKVFNGSGGPVDVILDVTGYFE